MCAHIKKYVIGKSADCDGNVGLNQDAANNIYLLRLADVYFLRAEAIMGTANSTTDPEALKCVNAVRNRAGLDDLTEISYHTLLKERRVEFAFESVNWYDIVRLAYREGNAAALEFLNSGYETGFNRAAMYVAKDGTNEHNDNNIDQYVIADTRAAGASYNPIVITDYALVVPIPAAATTASPQLLEAPVEYEGATE